MPRFIAKRLRDDWKLLLSIFFGITLASTLVAGAPVYLNSLERLSLNTAIDRSSSTFLDIFVFAPHIPLGEESLSRTDQYVDDSFARNTSEFYLGRERYLKGPTYLVGTDRRPLSGVQGALVSRGYFQNISNLDDHVTVLAGRLATSAIGEGPRGPRLEAVVGTSTANVFDLQAGEIIEITPTIVDKTRITVEIVGIVEPTDPTEEYWQHNANIFFDPQPVEEVPDVGVEVDPEEPPLALFVTKDTLVNGVGKAYPGTLVISNWFVFVDNEALKSFSIDDLRGRITALDRELSLTLRGSAVFTGIKALLNTFERRSFFSSVPLLLLLTITVITVLYYLGMMVSYLVQSRESDVALLRSRGVNTFQLFRLYATEGLALTILGAFIAPFIAMGVITVAGVLPYFQELTGGGMLPVQFKWMPFVVAAAIGLVSLAIYVIPAVFTARAGLVIHKLRSSRPPSTPLFQRFYLDVLLIIIGGLIFWELAARGQIVSGGLFSSIEVNEALLFAPVLFLTVVALLFMRFFPLFVRFISGESPTVIHLIVAAITLFLVPAIMAREIQAGNSFGWLLPVLLILGIAGAYWITHKSQRPRAVISGLVLQSLLVAGFVFEESFGTSNFSFLPTVGLILLVPLQLAFISFIGLSKVAPVWVSMSLWHMARNPLQYSWLVLMLVMVTGLGVLATTVGGTLNRSYQERVLYDTGADIRVTNVPAYYSSSNDGLKEVYLTIPGVTAVSLSLRGVGNLGATALGNSFEILGVESEDFAYISWYRDDFSRRPLSGIMRSLQPVVRHEPIDIPDDAVSIGVWAKPNEVYPNMFLWMAFQDVRGVVSTVTLGEMESPDEWTLMVTDLPRSLRGPLQLVSIQIYEPVFGPVGTAGAIELDDIQVFDANNNAQVLEDFESSNIRWSPLATSLLSSDRITLKEREPFNGRSSGLFTFGKDTDRGIRGVYQSTTGGPIPVVVSSTFLESMGARVGSTLIVNLFGRLLPVTIRDSVDFFPTMRHSRSGFMLADLDDLLRHINIVSPSSTIRPNEILITEAPGAGESVRDVVISIVGSPDLVHDRRADLEQIRLDPLIGAGWRAMVLVAMAIIVLTAGLGYITYLLAFADRSRAEMGFLQSLGLSKPQLIGLLTLEHMVIIIVGFVLGTLAGIQMSDLLVSSVAVTEEGRQVVPPFILETNWLFMGAIYVILIGIFVASIYRLNRSMIHLNLHSVSRVED